jgi:SAM-dependent methyltransferase
MTTAHDTPVRGLGRRDGDGCLILRDGAVAWEHGGEAATARAIELARDLSDMSDELAELGSSWPAAADCARERGHLLRTLDLGPEMRVLEVGAGCGAVARSLAERCALVDALEPNPLRARLAALRLADISSAQVIVGEIHDVPAEPTYDLIVLVGVLEYVGGWRGLGERVSFLRDLCARLRPGGHVACAIENRLGVEYFAGQPDDHSGLLFQGVEDHPRPHPARTFARSELEALFTAAGLQPAVFAVFPDYRFPRLLFSDALLESDARPLAWRVPRFPSPPHPSHRAAAVLDEQRLWRGLVENGMGSQFANSFLVVASRDENQALWPSDLLAVFYSTGRRRAFATESRVVAADSGIELRRRPLGAASVDESALVQRHAVEPYQDGEALIEILAEADGDELGSWLRRFRAFLADELAASRETVPFDLWPGNLIVVNDRLVAVDTEFTIRALSPDVALWRAFMLTALELAQRTPAERWTSRTVGELVDELARAADVTEPVPVADVVALQADLIAEIFGGPSRSAAWASLRDREAEALAAALGQPLEANVYGSRDAGPGLHARLAAAELERDAAVRELTALQGERTRADHLQAALATIEHSKSWRLTAPLRAARRVRRTRR